LIEVTRILIVRIDINEPTESVNNHAIVAILDTNGEWWDPHGGEFTAFQRREFDDTLKGALPAWRELRTLVQR
jgi:hypothetical protein